MDGRTRGTLEMTGAMLISGTVGWFVLMAGQPAATVVFWRCAFGALAMLVACVLLGGFKTAIKPRQLLLAAVGGVALVVNWVLLFGAYSRASIAVATVVYHTQPFMLVALGVLVFKERVNARTWAWLAAAFMGLLLVVNGQANGPGDYLAGVAMALGAAFFYALTAAITKRLTGMPPHLIVLIQMAVGCVMLAPFAEVISAQPPVQTWACLLAIGLIHTGLMSTLLYGALQKIPTALVGALSFIYPVVAVLVDRLALGHSLSVGQYAGGVLILAAAAGMTLQPKQRR